MSEISSGTVLTDLYKCHSGIRDLLTSRPMRLARPAVILVLACAPALAVAACGPVAGTSAPAPATSVGTPATNAATLAGSTPSHSVSSHPTRLPATSSRSPHSVPGRSLLPSVHMAPHYRASTSAAIHADHVVGHGTPGLGTSVRSRTLQRTPDGSTLAGLSALTRQKPMREA